MVPTQSLGIFSSTQLLALNYDSLGRFESAVQRPATRRLLGGESFQMQLIGRMRATRALFQAWHVGRGRPLGRGDLSAGGVTAAFLDEVQELAAEHAGQPNMLLAGLRDRRVKRFKSSKIEELEAHCLEQGFIDPRPQLSAEERFDRVLRACESEIASGALTPEDLRELADRLAGYLESGLPEAWDAGAVSAAVSSSDSSSDAHQASDSGSDANAPSDSTSEAT